MKAIGIIITHGKYNTPIPANQHQSLHSYHNAAMTSIFCVPASFHPVNITTRGTHASESYTLHITRRQARTIICICAFVALYSVTKLTCFVFTILAPVVVVHIRLGESLVLATQKSHCIHLRRPHLTQNHGPGPLVCS